jgi:hypothetical protein
VTLIKWLESGGLRWQLKDYRMSRGKCQEVMEGQVPLSTFDYTLRIRDRTTVGSRTRIPHTHDIIGIVCRGVVFEPQSLALCVTQVTRTRRVVAAIDVRLMI